MKQSISPAILREVAKKIENPDLGNKITGFTRLHFSLKEGDVKKVMFNISPEELAPFFTKEPVKFTTVYVGE